MRITVDLTRDVCDQGGMVNPAGPITAPRVTFNESLLSLGLTQATGDVTNRCPISTPTKPGAELWKKIQQTL